MMSIPTIAIERIYPNPRNVRQDLGDLTELSASIKAKGLLQPLVVQQTERGFLILDGHRRYQAALDVGAQALPCIAIRPGDEDQQDTVMLAAAMHKSLTPIEQGQAFKRLRARGLTVQAIASRTGYKPSTISQRLLLLTLPESAQRMVVEKTMTVTEATDLARQVAATGRGEARTPASSRGSWFTGRHQLAEKARECTHLDARRAVGGIACGQCWEEAIREDERSRSC